MRASGTLSRSIALEIAIYAGLGFASFVLILTVQEFAGRLKDLVEVGLTGSDTWAVIRSVLPVVSSLAVPVGFLFGILVTVGRMSADSELVAMRSCGLGIGSVVLPVFCMAVVISLLTGFLVVRVEPASRLALRGLLQQVASRGAILEPGRFQNVAGRVVYVRSRDRDQLEQVMVADRTHPGRPFLIFAERGRFRFDPDQVAIHLELDNGDLHLIEDDRDTHRRIFFRHFDYVIDASSIINTRQDARPRELSMAQLSERIAQADAGLLPNDVLKKDPVEYRIHYYRRLALPFAPMIFALLGVPLGMRRSRGVRSWGFLICAGLVSAYYLLFAFGQYLAESGDLPVVYALWLPNAVFAAAALPLLRRAQRGGV
jgi:lipopolysaccharide export system permease protein